MSRFNEPKLPELGPAPGAGRYEASRPFSKAAITGFVCSLVPIPVITQLLGLIFGLVGIFATRGGQRRGKGLAIAAIPISLLVAAVWGAVFSFGIRAQRAIEASNQEVFRALRATGPEREQALNHLYEDRLSDPAKARVSAAQFRDWAEAVRRKHGQLQEARRDRAGRSAEGIEVRYVGEFVNGSASITLRYKRPDPRRAEFTDLSVDGVSPIPD